jgi:hypothetical protein
MAPTGFQAIQLSLLAWKEKVTANTVKNCWGKSGLLPDSVLDLTAAAPAAPLQRQTSAEADDLEAAPLEVTADTSDSMAEPVLQELAEAMQSFQALAEQRGLLPERQDFVTAEQFVELDGENEVFSELSAEEIVALVQSQLQGMDKADSDEDEEDDHKACEITIAQAVSCAEQKTLHLPVLNSFVQSRCLHWFT